MVYPPADPLTGPDVAQLRWNVSLKADWLMECIVVGAFDDDDNGDRVTGCGYENHVYGLCLRVRVWLSPALSPVSIQTQSLALLHATNASASQ